MISKLSKLKLSALIGIALGVGLILFAEPETAAGASALVATGLIPSLIIGHLFSKRAKSKRSPKNSDSSNNA